MNLSQLEAFVATCKSSNYSRAADLLFISQPALHHKVKQLENELGVPLLLVRDRKVVPTAEGTMLLESAQRIVTEVRDLQWQFDGLSNNNVVRIGSASLLATAILPVIIESNHGSDDADRPLVEVVEADPSSDLGELFMNERLDVGIKWETQPSNGLKTEPFISCDVVCAAHPQHPLAGDGVRSVRDIADWPLALTSKGTSIRDAVDGWWRRHIGESMGRSHFVVTNEAQAAHVTAMSRELITFLPAPTVMATSLAEIKLDVPAPRLSTMLCYPAVRGRRLAVKKLLAILRGWAKGTDVGSPKRPPKRAAAATAV